MPGEFSFTGPVNYSTATSSTQTNTNVVGTDPLDIISLDSYHYSYFDFYSVNEITEFNSFGNVGVGSSW